ncbi:MAG: TonB C-terminal domain-containing protein [Campylobacterota bacterium]|nr:TonB C-terminal domain-containing protein [Campylobacterota bacterium]
MENRLKFISGLLAFFVYFVLLGLLISYFNHHTKKKSIHYADKSSKAIAVSLSMSPNKVDRTKKSSSPKKKSEVNAKPKEIQKPEKTASEKKIKSVSPTPSKTVKTSKKVKTEKKVKVSNLFDKIKEKKPIEKKEKKPEKKRIKKAKAQDSGVKNAYFAKVEKMLYNWPSQSEFAGERIKVWLKIRQDGTFEFKLLSASNNEEFNTGLIQYLQQLQRIGFDPHQHAKPYELNVEFVAKE